MKLSSIAEFVLGPGVATFLLLPLAGIGVLGFGIAFGDAIRPGSAAQDLAYALFVLPFLLMAVGGIVGLVGLWLAVLCGGDMLRVRGAFRRFVIAALAIGIVAAGTFFTLLVWGMVEDDPSGWGRALAWGPIFVLPIAIGARRMVNLIRLGSG